MSTADAAEKSAVNGIRTALGIGGVLAVIVGILILAWPGKTAMVVAAIIAIYAIAAGLVYAGLGIFSKNKGGWARVGHIALGVLFVIAGVVALMNLGQTTAWLAVFIGIVCVVVGWPHVTGTAQRWRLVWTQALHWAAFLVAMNMVFLPSVQSLLNADSTSLLVLFQLALGTFVAGVHTGSVKLCINGIVIALMVPAIAWLDRSALMLTILATVAVAAAAIVLWRKFSRAL